ncbi:hypothetical protein PENCOP_c002G04211 [Penicillium coprophilum]|uniref:Carrier domain-containing protein n=1 Tax=Penicillium coprophilum TaxID=36646 RepID=A0A1V6V0M7_9EURO|nr:hypothetical protein PENCOP_c002G04211 [Penicillium coprophilum]
MSGKPALYRVFASPNLTFFLSLLSAKYLLGNNIDASNTGTNFMTVNLDWREDTLSVDDDGAPENKNRRVGLKPIPAEYLARFLDYILAGATALDGPIHSTLFREARRGINEIPVGGGDDEEEQSFEQVIADGGEDAVADFTLRAITRKISQLLSVDVGTVDETLALGLDSLVAVELRNWILKRFEATLQSADVLVNQTPRALAERVAARSSLVNALA